MGGRAAGILALGLTLFVAVAAQAQEPPAQQDPARLPPLQFGVSLDRIKAGLEQLQPAPLKILPDQPTFRIDIVERRRFRQPAFADTLKSRWQPVPSGGIDHYEIMNMITPPEARPYAGFNSTELAQVMATSLVTALIVKGLQRAAGYTGTAWRERNERAARDQVRRELEEFLFANPDAPRPIWWIGTIR